MNVHVLQHVPFEDIGCMAGWLAARDATPSYTRFFQGDALPPLEGLDGLDLLIVMGGPMSVNDEAELPWLRAEKAFVRQAIHSGVAVLGICLGAQLMANALGGRVYPNAIKEIGWFPIQGVAGSGFAFPAEARVFQWHGETFDLPPGAVHLARSQVCEHQAFQIGPRAIGLQFHLETTPESADAILTHCRDELIPGPCIQSEAAIRAADAATYAEANRLMGEVLGYLTRPAA